jgi:hypothetical protein
MLEAGDRVGPLLRQPSLTETAGSKNKLRSAAPLQSCNSTMLTKCMLMEVMRNYNQKHHLSMPWVLLIIISWLRGSE